MTAWILPPAAQLLAAADVTGDAAAGVVTHRFARLDDFDDPRVMWSLVAAASAALVVFVIWQYRRERAAISTRATVGLGFLRVIALAGAVLFFLAPVKRIDQRVTTDSRVAILVDSSQSMAVSDEAAPGNSLVARRDAVLEQLASSPLLAELNARHDIELAVFDAELRAVSNWKRLRSDSPKKNSSAAADEDPNRDAGELASALATAGAETRLGDALNHVLAQQAAGPLAGVIVFSDGGQNRGADPLAVADVYKKAEVPILTVGVGSAAPRQNVRLQDLIAPARAYPNDAVKIRTVVQAEGLRGQRVEVELVARPAEGEGPEFRLGAEQLTFDEDAATVQAVFDFQPDVVGRVEFEARLIPPAADQYADDNRRLTEMEVVDASQRVLLIASGATRDYRFLRDQLRRDPHMAVDVLLQLSPSGISQDADAILQSFPTSRQALFEYDAIVAFDPDWTRLDAEQVEILEEWVSEEAGGMIVVAGPVHTAGWLQSEPHAKIRALYPVEFQRRLTLLDDGLFGSKTAWPLQFTPEGREAPFLWLADTPQDSREAWESFPGVFGCYAVRGPKRGAQVYARYSDPDAGVAVERPVYFAEHFYGAGRIFYMGSGELWRLRGVDPGYFERLYTQLVRRVSEGRLMRGSSFGRLLVERDRYPVGSPVMVRAQLSTSSREPYQAEAVTAFVSRPASREESDSRSGGVSDGNVLRVQLHADKSRPGNFIGEFTAGQEGSYVIDVSVPEVPGEVLTRRIAAVAPDLEFEDTRRNEALLAALASRTSGAYYTSVESIGGDNAGLQPVARLLESRAETKVIRGNPDREFTKRVNACLLGVICGALCLEWLARRLLKLA